MLIFCPLTAYKDEQLDSCLKVKPKCLSRPLVWLACSIDHKFCLLHVREGEWTKLKVELNVK